MSTMKLAEFASAIKYSDLNSATVRLTKQCILDNLGIAIKGSQEPSTQMIKKFFTLQGGKEQATVYDASCSRTSSAQAAFINSASSHSLDFDDLHNASIVHVACVVVPPVLAVGEAEHKSGKQMLAATVAGWELAARAGEAVIPESYYFWHTTGTAGTFGAAAAVANLLGLSAEQTLHCYGTAGTQVSGSWEFLKEGTMGKFINVGTAAYAGVLSAYLAREGYTGASEPLEGAKGFCRAMVAQPHLEKLTVGLGEGYKICENSFKPYACCKHSHAAAYAMHELSTREKFTVADIEAVELHVNHVTNILINNATPQTPYGCKFSIQYIVAAMLKWGELGVREFLPSVITDADTRAVMAKTTVIEDPAVQAVYDADPQKLASQLVVRLKGGRKFEMLVEYPKGDPPNPMTWEDTVAKFVGLAEPVYGEAKALRLVELLDKLEEVEDYQVALAEALGEG